MVEGAFAAVLLSGPVLGMKANSEKLYAQGKIAAKLGPSPSMFGPKSSTSALAVVSTSVYTNPLDTGLTIDYDAPARLAWNKLGSKGDFEAFKFQYIQETIEMVSAKKVAREKALK